MLKLTEIVEPDRARAPARRRVILTAEDRRRSRLAVRLSDGTQAALYLPRGSVLGPGSLLRAENGELIEVVAADEALYRVTPKATSAEPGLDLLRAAYHLGNRHVPVALQAGALAIERDPVLRDLLVRLGLEVSPVFEPFVPEAGAYGAGHRHDSDPEGGSIGESLSQAAHGSRHG